ncbi:DUF72 domain-containing protein [uncultured Paludibaculum sp.]|uniref:DUF72 domain-containing protein n=1 Tax=uncultured Paludibaculum sp. TaxID=1765020 RepID=UPI002AAA9DC8|nr:DUF72 domain-containing protein [uncultured Paludibaculum sp.]
MNLSLFPTEPTFRDRLAARLRALAAEGIYVGTSSWKYPGWLDQVYTPERYFTRGRFSQKKFESECLSEFSEIFPTVCGDFTFYQFPSPEYWQRLFASAQPSLQFAFKVPEEITVREWPTHLRYGARGGLENESFLNADLFQSAFLGALEPYRNRVGVLVFEFGMLPKRHYGDVEPFAADLDAFLEKLPPGWRYSVEIRNREFFDERYFRVLRSRNVAHVFNSWTRMPELRNQLAEPAAQTADFLVARAQLKPGRTFEQAVEKFQPYREIQEEYPPAREGLKEILERAHKQNTLSFLFVSNRLEGNAPGTIAAVTGAEEE